MEKINEKIAVALLKRQTHSSYRYIIRHAKKVAQVATKIARQVQKKHEVNIGFVKTASLLHDIGRHICPPFDRKKSPFHGVEGAKILREYGLEKHARAAERHLGGGIDRKEARKIGLEKGVYLPKTTEEKIVCYADKLVADEKKIPIQKSIDRFRNEIGRDSAERIRKLHNELVKMGMKGRRIDTK